MKWECAAETEVAIAVAGSEAPRRRGWETPSEEDEASTADPDVSPPATATSSFSLGPPRLGDVQLEGVAFLSKMVRASWPALEAAATRTSAREYELLTQTYLLLEVGSQLGGTHGAMEVELETLGKDVCRSAQWVRSSQVGAMVTWPLPPLDGPQLGLLRRMLRAFAARADEHIAAGSPPIRVRYVQAGIWRARDRRACAMEPAWGLSARTLRSTAAQTKPNSSSAAASGQRCK